MAAFGNFKTAVLVTVIAIGMSGAACANDESERTRTITVTGQGQASGAPDQAHVNAGVQTMAPTVEEATRQNQAAVGRIMDALKQQGIAEKHIQTSNYSIWPEQRQDPRRNGELSITGYRVSNTVNVTITEIDKVGKVLGAVTDAGANTIHGVNFSVQDDAALEQQARAAAMANAIERATSLAALAGVELGDVQTISMASGGGHPVPMMANARMAMAEAASVPGIAPGELSVSVQVHVVFAIR